MIIFLFSNNNIRIITSLAIVTILLYLQLRITTNIFQRSPTLHRSSEMMNSGRTLVEPSLGLSMRERSSNFYVKFTEVI